ncbi:MAG: YqgE/AlgH family protein [Pseudomonadota bacterium]
MQHKVRLIASSPNMLDTIFRETVILLLENDQYGAFGFVLNKPRDLNLDEVYLGEKSLGPAIYNAWYGGPVDEQRGFLLCDTHRLNELGIEWNESDEDQLPIREGIITTANPMITEDIIWQHFEQLTEADKELDRFVTTLPFRFILGYSGWSAEQLDKEVAEGWWIEIPWDKSLIFSTSPQNMWHEALKSIGITSVGNYISVTSELLQ